MTFADALRWVVEGTVTLIVLHQAVLAARRRGWLGRRSGADGRDHRADAPARHRDAG